MLLHIVRHARTKENNLKILQGHHDSVLDEIGLQQASILAKRFKETNLTHIYTSDLKRAYDTAVYIHAEQSNTKFVVTEQLREKSFGQYDGMLKTDIARDIGVEDPKLIYDIITTLPGAETGSMVDARVTAFMQTFLASHRTTDDIVILLTHAGFKHHLIKYLYQQSSKEVTSFLKFKNTAISSFSITKHSIEEIVLNDYSHLPPELCD